MMKNSTESFKTVSPPKVIWYSDLYPYPGDMKDLLEELKDIKYKLDFADYTVEWYEIREKVETGSMDGYPAARAVGSSPLEALAEWDNIDSDEYVIEVFLENSLDRIVYEKGEEPEYVSFSEGRKAEELSESLDAHSGQ
jgi:hypothetical protein